MNAPVIEGARVVITGGAGFIGSHIADYCEAAGADVTIFDDLSHAAAPSGSRRFVRGDIRRLEDVMPALDGADILFHHGAIASVPECSDDPLTGTDVNAQGVSVVLEALRRTRSKTKVVFASSAAVYGNSSAPHSYQENEVPTPHSVYGATKLAGEVLARSYATNYGIDVRIVRYANVYGPRQPRYIMFDMYNKVRAARDYVDVIGSGLQERDFIYVSDAVAYTVAVAASPGASGEVYNVGTGVASSVLDVAAMVRDAMGRSSLELRPTGASWLGDVNYLLCDVTKVQKAFGAPDTSLSDGVKRFVQWMDRAVAQSPVLG